MSPILTRMIGAGSAGSGFGFGRRRGGAGRVPFSATGGTITTGSGPASGYTIHTFTATSTFNIVNSPGNPINVDLLVVGGGGGGGGGGGAVRYIPNVLVPTGSPFSFPIIIGDYSPSAPGISNGNPSSALGYTANGGGGNPGGTGFPLNNGGSPGGGSGGLNHDSGDRSAGNGTQVNIEGNNYYWGGGGGGNGNNSPGAPGGLGGGGGGGTSNATVGSGGGSALNTGNPGPRASGSPTNTPISGFGGANTGGGGGGGAGANGICIIRYLSSIIWGK